MKITEGISGYWHYHLSEDNKITRGLCGAKTMSTEIPISGWGIPGGDHLPKRYTYCAECEKLAALRDIKAGQR